MNHALSRCANRAFSRAVVSKVVVAGLVSVCTLQVAVAQEAPRSFLGLGAISVPEFEGSADQATRPFLVGRVDFGQRGSLRLAGLAAQYNLLDTKSNWAFGPVLSIRPARDKDVEDPVVKRLREVDTTTEAGLFVEYGFRDTWMQGDRVAVGFEAKGGKGNQFTWTANYLGIKAGAVQYGADLRVTYANDKHMDTYFSVDANNSMRSGLPTYSASGGLKSIAIGFTGSYDLGQEWVLIGRLGLSRLAGDANDSPIVKLRGDSSAVSVGVALGYRF
jgi:outer membrane protein